MASFYSLHLPLQCPREPEEFALSCTKHSSEYNVIKLDESACADGIYTIGKSHLVICTKKNMFLFDGSNSSVTPIKHSAEYYLINLASSKDKVSTVVTTAHRIGVLKISGKDVSSPEVVEITEKLDYVINHFFEPILEGSKLYLVGYEKGKESLPFIACIDISAEKLKMKTLWKSHLTKNESIKFIKFSNHIVVISRQSIVKICAEKGTQEKIPIGLTDIVAANKISDNQLCLYNCSPKEKSFLTLNIETKESTELPISNAQFQGLTLHGAHLPDHSWVLGGGLHPKKNGLYCPKTHAFGLYHSKDKYTELLKDNTNPIIHSSFDKNGTLIVLTGPSMTYFAQYRDYGAKLGYTIHFFDSKGNKVIDSINLTKKFPDSTFCSGFTVTSEGKIALVGTKVTSYEIKSFFDSDFSTDSDRYFEGQYETALYVLSV